MKQRILPRRWIIIFRELLVLALGTGMATVGQAEISPKYYAVEASVTVQESPPRIMLTWPDDPRATSYTIHRKAPGGGSWSTKANLPGNARSYVDSDIVLGTAYEYQITKSTSYGYSGFAYLLAGVRTPLVDQRGKVILIVDGTHAAELAPELARLQQDLAGDGWTVVRSDVSRQDSVQKVKALVKAHYDADRGNVRAVFLFGHVAVPYAGNFYPDGHDNHKGAWPADVYYGDMDGVWTDSTVNTRSAERSRNWNTPGDGKFDQSELPSDVELEVGRVDLFDMTCFANKTPARTEKDLLRQYLNKDHNFRHGRIRVDRRGLICDNFGERGGEAFAASGWRNFSGFFGASNVSEAPGWTYFPTVTSQSYLWTYGTGGGSWYECNGIGSSDDFARNDIKTVFTMFLGSYFGDWDNESNFLRAPLGSTSYTLTSSWSGRPHWYYHHMALGETIGYSTRLSQNNRAGGLYSASQYGTREVHVALMGDPTLRMHPVTPPDGVRASSGSTGVRVEWSPSPDTDVQGYHVYRGETLAGPFARLTRGGVVNSTSYTDSAGAARHVYMVRAIKLERSASGTYLNPSQGIFTVPSGSEPPVPPGPMLTAPEAPAVTDVPAKAAFIRTDTATGGDWKGTYGADGFHIVGDSVQYPPYAIVTSNGNNRFEWGDSTADPRALLRAGGDVRVPVCWFSDSSFAIEVNLVDGQSHRFALYCVDWDTNERGQKVEILDAASSAVLDSRTVANFNAGVYLVWDVQGRIRVRLTRESGNNALLMGYFFGSPSAEPGGSGGLPSALIPTLGQGRFHLRIEGQAGQRFVIEGSSDLRSWSPVSTVTLTTGVYDFVDPAAASVPSRFYRAVEAP